MKSVYHNLQEEDSKHIGSAFFVLLSIEVTFNKSFILSQGFCPRRTLGQLFSDYLDPNREVSQQLIKMTEFNEDNCS